MPLADLTDVQMYYELHGDGEPLVLIPGLGSTCLIWAPILSDLAQNFTGICLDNRGIGQSIAKRRARRVCDYGADVIELMDYLQLPQAHVLGLSLGGMVAQRVALDHLARVKRLILISCAHQFGPYLREMARLIEHTLRWFPTPLFARTMEILGAGPPFFDSNPHRIDQRLARMREARVPARAVVKQLRALRASNFRPDQYHIGAPTMVISGEHDSLIPHCYAREMAKRIPDSQFLLISDAGHNPFHECPDKVLPRVISFLQEPLPSSQKSESWGRRSVA